MQAGRGAAQEGIALYNTPLYTIVILPLSIYSSSSARAYGGGRSDIMSESKILQSLEDFKNKYAWDKSLLTGHSAPSVARARPMPDSSIQDYLREHQASQQSDARELTRSGVL